MTQVAGARVTEPAAGLSGRERIRIQAQRLFLEQGYAAVSMQQIADAASVNKATLYHHYRDKEDLFLAVLGAEFGRIESGIQGALALGGSLREQLERVAASMLSATGCDVGRLVSELHRHVGAERRAELQSRSRFPWEVLSPAFAAAAARGELRAGLDPGIVAELFFGMILSQIRRAKFDQRPPDPSLAHTIAGVLLDGAGPSDRSA